MESAARTDEDKIQGPAAGRRITLLRGAALLASLGLLAGAQYRFAAQSAAGWRLVLAAVLFGLVWQWRLMVTDWLQTNDRQWQTAPQRSRQLLGLVVTMGGLWLWCDASRRFAEVWDVNFDRTWLTWIAAAAVMSLGLRLFQVPQISLRRPGAGESARMPWWEWLIPLLALAVAGGYRLGNLASFPPADAVSQVEELQQGQWAALYLSGQRGKWEFLGQMWVAAAGIWLGGPSLVAMRAAISTVSMLTVFPAYFWFRSLAGRAGAIVGTALLATSGWATIVNRNGGHQDALPIAICMALLTGSAIRGAWAAYPWVALLAGYSLYSYIPYRTLAVFAGVAAVIVWHGRRRSGRWLPPARELVPVVLLAVLMGVMFFPLAYRLRGEFSHQYLNGWNRAHAVEEYYGPQDDWSVALEKRWARISQAANLYFADGDGNPTHNVDRRPLIDATTGALLIVGIGFSALHLLRGFYGLTLAALALTFAGTLVATGNLDVTRGAATTVYVYALAAIGAGSVFAAAGRSFGRSGRWAAGAALTGAVLWGGVWNARLIADWSHSPVVLRHFRNDLAYLSVWLRDHANGRRVIGLVPTGANVVFLDNDASWLRGPGVDGESTWDVGSTLRKLAAESGEVVLLIGASEQAPHVAEFFESVVPGLTMVARYDDTTGDVRMVHGAIVAPAQLSLSQHWRRVQCTGVRARFVLRRADDSVLGTFEEIIPFIDQTTWPGALRLASFEQEREAKWIDAEWHGSLTMPESDAGEYHILVDSYEGRVTATIDDIVMPGGQEQAVNLSPGPHTFRMTGRFNARPVEPTARVWWRKSTDDGTMQPLPFYRLAPVDPTCLAAGPSSDPG